MSETVSKRISPLAIKDEARGEVEAVVATLGLVDRDGDVIKEGAIPNGSPVKLSDYGHSVVYADAQPVGAGRIYIKDDKAVFRGRLFLDTARGRETFVVLRELKAMGAEQEWSFGFRVLGAERPDEEWRAKGALRILTKLHAVEVSPVLVGAGIGTGTVAVKREQCVSPEELAAVTDAAIASWWRAQEALGLAAKSPVANALDAEAERAMRLLDRHGGLAVSAELWAFAVWAGGELGIAGRLPAIKMGMAPGRRARDVAGSYNASEHRVFITPGVADPAGTLAHELVHAKRALTGRGQDEPSVEAEARALVAAWRTRRAA